MKITNETVNYKNERENNKTANKKQISLAELNKLYLLVLIIHI